MSLADEIARLQAIRREADAIFAELEALAQADREITQTLLGRLSRAADELDAAARAAAAERRAQTILELSSRIAQYDVLLSLGLAPATRARIAAERATLVAQRGYHRGRAGTDFEGIVSADDVRELAAAITAVRRALAQKRKAIAYIDGVIRMGMAAGRLVGILAAG